MKKLFLLLCSGLLIVGGCARVKDRSPVIAVVNGRELHKTEFERFLTARLGELTGSETPDSLRSQMLDEFVERRLVLDQAGQAGVSVSESEIEQATVDNPQTKASPDSAGSRQEMANDLTIAKYYRQFVLRDVRPSPEEVQKYIDDNRERLADHPGFVVREIRVDNRDKAESLRREVVEGHRDFAEVAGSGSQAPNAEEGGLSRYDEGQLPEVLERAIRPLKPGDVSQVIQSSFGFHVFKLERRIKPHSPEDRRAQLETKRSQLIEELIARKNQEAVDEALARFLDAAGVRVIDSSLGFTYTGRLRHNSSALPAHGMIDGSGGPCSLAG